MSGVEARNGFAKPPVLFRSAVPVWLEKDERTIARLLDPATGEDLGRPKLEALLGWLAELHNSAELCRLRESQINKALRAPWDGCLVFGRDWLRRIGKSTQKKGSARRGRLP